MNKIPCAHDPRFLAQFLLECMTGSWSDKVPALIGGGVRHVIGSGSKTNARGPGVTVLAAVMPGVEVRQHRQSMKHNIPPHRECRVALHSLCRATPHR